MSTYSVTVSIFGNATIFIEADNEKEALEKALNEGWGKDCINEWELITEPCRGNVCHLPIRKPEVRKESD